MVSTEGINFKSFEAAERGNLCLINRMTTFKISCLHYCFDWCATSLQTDIPVALERTLIFYNLGAMSVCQVNNILQMEFLVCEALLPFRLGASMASMFVQLHRELNIFGTMVLRELPKRCRPASVDVSRQTSIS